MPKKIVLSLINILLFLAFVAWILLLSPFSLLGFLYRGRKKPLPTSEVDASPTVCKMLWYKGLISREDYEFEFEQVSQKYSGNIFHGYQFLVIPVIFLLKTSKIIDDLILFFVSRWIVIQKSIILGKGSIPSFDKYLSKFAIKYAEGIGKFLFFITPTKHLGT